MSGSLDGKRTPAMEALVVTLTETPTVSDQDITNEINSYMNQGWVLIEVTAFGNKTRGFFQRVKR